MAMAMAMALGDAPWTKGCIWRTLGLLPHRSAGDTLSKAPLLVDQKRDDVGLDPCPPLSRFACEPLPGNARRL